MPKARIIPTLLLRDGGLVKTVKFSNERYIGDPINAMRIFNQKEVDELVLLDISASLENKPPAFEEIKDIVSEAFMPIGYGGGISSMNHIESLFNIGVEKVILNTAAFTNERLIQEAADVFGSQSIVVALDVKKDLFGNYKLYTKSGTVKQKIELETAMNKYQELGAGEILVNNIDRDGMMKGYDLGLIKKVSGKLKIPLVVAGGAGSKSDLVQGVKAGASAVAAGSLFVYQGIHKAVLISYICADEIDKDL